MSSSPLLPEITAVGILPARAADARVNHRASLSKAGEENADKQRDVAVATNSPVCFSPSSSLLLLTLPLFLSFSLNLCHSLCSVSLECLLPCLSVCPSHFFLSSFPQLLSCEQGPRLPNTHRTHILKRLHCLPEKQMQQIRHSSCSPELQLKSEAWKREGCSGRGCHRERLGERRKQSSLLGPLP